MKLRPVFKKIKSVLRKGQKAFIFFHISPEGDCIGSALALAEILGSLGLKPQIFSEDKISDDYLFMPGAGNILNNDARLKKGADLAFVIDCGDISRIGHFKDKLSQIPLIINIDHHSDNQYFGGINYVETVAAAGEQIFKLAKYLKTKITPSIATNLYVAIVTDTGGFRFANTTAESLAIAAELVASGAKIEEINRHLYENKSLGFLKILCQVIGRAEPLFEDQLICAALSYDEIKALNVKDDELNELVDYFKILAKPKAIFLLREIKPGLVKVNLRSRAGFSVQKIARAFGGGGHPAASGCQVKGNLETVKLRLIEETKKYLTQ